MEEIKNNLLKHFLKIEGTVKDFTEAITKVEVFFQRTGHYPYSIMINGKIITCR